MAQSKQTMIRTTIDEESERKRWELKVYLSSETDTALGRVGDSVVIPHALKVYHLLCRAKQDGKETINLNEIDLIPDALKNE